jgi:hypothetical protein
LKHNINLCCGCFLDLPIGKKENKMAVTGYSVFYDYDFGQNLQRSHYDIGSVDPNFTGSRALQDLEMHTYGSGIHGTNRNFTKQKQTNLKFVQPLDFTYKTLML